MVVVESTRVSQVTPESPGIPRAMVLTASFALSPATGLSCHRRLRTCIRKLDTSVGVSGPHDFSVRLSALRPKAHPRPPHPTPRFVTLRNAPLWDRTARVVDLICPTPKAKYFCKQDWTGQITLKSLNKSPRPRDGFGLLRWPIRGRTWRLQPAFPSNPGRGTRFISILA